jgi:hypothetical protein
MLVDTARPFSGHTRAVRGTALRLSALFGSAADPGDASRGSYSHGEWAGVVQALSCSWLWSAALRVGALSHDAAPPPPRCDIVVPWPPGLLVILCVSREPAS